MPHLLLVRHAKSDWPVGVDDHARPLSKRGVRDATALGVWLREHSSAVSRVIVSTAARTQRTWELCAAAAGIESQVDNVDAIYEAHWTSILAFLQELDDESCVLVIGHNPGLEDLASELAGPVGAPLEALEEKFPTSAVAHLEFTGAWSSLRPGSARLVEFVIPRG